MANPSNIALANLPGLLKASNPLIDTSSAGRDGTRTGGGSNPDPDPQGIIFQDSFDNQPDWHSGLAANDTGANPEGFPDRIQRAGTHTFLNGWYSCYQDPRWSESQGYPGGREAISVLASDSDKARGGTGKCYVGARDSYNAGWKNWATDSSLLKYFPIGFSEIYVEFWIRFMPGWTTVPGWTSKLFRISSWSEQGSEFQAFGGGELGPIFLWDWENSGYGLRNRLSFRGGPHGDNYGMTSADIPGLPRSLVGSGDLAMNFTDDMAGMGVGGTMPQIVDRVNGGFISDNLSQNVSHEQIFGDGSEYTKMGFYVKMNSAPGVNDGVARQWLNDEQIFNNEQIAWVGPTSAPMPKFNVVLIGGNDYFQEYPNADLHQEWYAIDDVVMRDSIPEGL